MAQASCVSLGENLGMAGSEPAPGEATEQSPPLTNALEPTVQACVGVARYLVMLVATVQMTSDRRAGKNA